MGAGRVPWVVVLLVNLVRPDSFMSEGRDSPEDFVIQAKADCYFTNGTEKVRFVVRFIFNLEEYLHFDSDLGMFVALTELGEPDAEQWNRRWDLLERSRASVNMVCRQNYRLGAPFTVGRNVPPEVTVYPERPPLLRQHNLLLCSVTGFYPGDINVGWFRNGQEERSGVISTGLVRNGDWTFQMTVMLEMTPELGDVYSCLVEHPSLQSPISVEWVAQSEYSWKKILSGGAAFLLGLIVFLVGVVIHLKARKASVETRSGDETNRQEIEPSFGKLGHRRRKGLKSHLIPSKILMEASPTESEEVSEVRGPGVGKEQCSRIVRCGHVSSPMVPSPSCLYFSSPHFQDAVQKFP